MKDQSFIEEEMFCLKFELDALAQILLKNESERMVPNFSLGVVEHDHKDRYKLACHYSKDNDVLDIACGAGYGSNMLVTKGNAKSVTGCDLDIDAVKYAQHRYKNSGLSFSVQNAEKFRNENKYDLIISYETIEHLPNYKSFLENVQINMMDNAYFIVSTPISQFDFDEKPKNRYHTQEWGFLAFQKEIAQFFDIDKIYIQLYQNEFVNDSKIDFYNKVNNSIFKKIKGYLKSKLRGTYNGPWLLDDWTAVSNYSVLSEFVGQYSIDTLGKKYKGYQILICKKKNE